MESREGKGQGDDRLLLRVDEVARLISVCPRSAWAWTPVGVRRRIPIVLQPDGPAPGRRLGRSRLSRHRRHP